MRVQRAAAASGGGGGAGDSPAMPMDRRRLPLETTLRPHRKTVIVRPLPTHRGDKIVTVGQILRAKIAEKRLGNRVELSAMIARAKAATIRRGAGAGAGAAADAGAGAAENTEQNKAASRRT